jgi:uncharacterized protein YxjI
MSEALRPASGTSDAATAALAARLAAVAQVFVRQHREPWEWIAGFETRNRYAVVDEAGAPVAWAAEQQKGALGFLLRQVLGHWRRFELHVFDPARALALRVVHPFRWLFQRLEVLAPDGRRIGAIQQRFAFLSKRFDVEDARGRPVLRVRSGILRWWRFDFERNGRVVARVDKRWSGLLGELFTDRDVFRVTFEPALDADERLVLLAAAIFVDLRYFERKA